MSSKKILGESIWKSKVQKEKTAAKLWESKYGFLRDEMLNVRQEVQAVIGPYSISKEYHVVYLPDNEVTLSVA